MLNITIKGLHIPLTEAITDAVHNQVRALEKNVHTSALVNVELGKSSRHHKSGDDLFVTEITLDVSGRTYFYTVAAADLYISLDQCVERIADMIKQGKGKRQTVMRKGRMLVKKLLRQAF